MAATTGELNWVAPARKGYESELRLLLRESHMTAARSCLPFACLLVGCGGGGDSAAPPPPPSVTAVSVSPGSVSLYGVGSEATVTASLSPSGASGTVIWHVVDPSLASVSAAGASATVRALSGGSTQVVASVGAREGTAAVTVTPIARRLTVSPTIASVRVGANVALDATLEADTGVPTTLQWTPAAPAIATVSPAGIVTGIAPGTTTITVASVAFPAISAQSTITVTNPTVSVGVSPATASLLPGATSQLTATVNAEPGAATTVDWTSSATAIAVVSGTGLVTAVSPGTATITATSTANTTVSATATVTVTAPTVRSISLTPVTATLLTGSTRQLNASVVADPGVATTLTWSSSALAVATVDAIGLVTALAPGTTIITARSTAVPSVTATATITVTLPPPLTNWTSIPIGNWSIPLRSGAVDLWQADNGLAFSTPYPGPDGVGKLLVLRGSAWGLETLLPFDDGYAIGGFSGAGTPGAPPPIWVSRATGTGVAKWNGTSFAGMTVPVTDGPIIAIEGTSASTAVAVTKYLPSAGGSPVRRSEVLVIQDGGSFKLPESPMGDLRGISATGVNDIVVVGQSYFTQPYRTAARWDGATWTMLSLPPGASGEATSVARTVAGSLVVVWKGPSLQGESALWNGLTWTAIANPTRTSLYDGFERVVRCGADVIAGTTLGRVLRLDGASWTLIAEQDVAAPGGTSDPRCGTGGVLRMLGGSAITRRTGNQWTIEAYVPNLSAVKVLRPDLAWAIGGNAQVWKWDGVQWSIAHSAFHGTYNQGLTMTASADGFVLAIGYEKLDDLFGSRQIHRYDQGAWRVDVLPGIGSPMVAWASSRNWAMALGTDAAWRWDGSTWATSGTPPIATLMPTAIDGSAPTNVLALFGGSRIARWNGVTWQETAIPGNPTGLNAISVYSPSLAYVAGQNSRILRWDGTQWLSSPLGASFAALNLVGVSVVSPSEVYAVAAQGHILRFDGTTWSQAGFAAPRQGSTGAQAISAVPGFGIVTGASALLWQSTPLGGMAAAQLRFKRERASGKQ